MAFTGTARDALFRTAADPMPIRGSVGMDAGAVAGKRDAVLGDKPVLKGGEEGSKAEDLLEPFLIMEGEFRVVQGVSRQLIRDAGMLIGKLLPFAGLFGRLSIFIFREKVLPAGPLGGFGLRPEPVHEVKIRAQRGKGIRGTADERGEEAVRCEFYNPGGKAGEALQGHEDKGTDDLHLVFGGPSDRGIESGKISHYRIQVQQAELIPDRAECELEPCALGRIKVYFCLMQEIQVLLMGLPVNQHMCVLLWSGEKWIVLLNQRAAFIDYAFQSMNAAAQTGRFVNRYLRIS